MSNISNKQGNDVHENKNESTVILAEEIKVLMLCLLLHVVSFNFCCVNN